jgi:hypothetical protein
MLDDPEETTRQDDEKQYAPQNPSRRRAHRIRHCRFVPVVWTTGDDTIWVLPALLLEPSIGSNKSVVRVWGLYDQGRAEPVSTLKVAAVVYAFTRMHTLPLSWTRLAVTTTTKRSSLDVWNNGHCLANA